MIILDLSKFDKNCKKKIQSIKLINISSQIFQFDSCFFLFRLKISTPTICQFVSFKKNNKPVQSFCSDYQILHYTHIFINKV